MSLQLPIDFDVQTLTVAPSPFVQARETSALAAVANLPRRGTQNAVILGLIDAAGEDGLSDEEIRDATGYSRQTICARRGNLRAFLEPAARRAKSPSGIWMTCWKRRAL